MSFEPASLAASFLVSGIGFVLFTYGRRMARFPQLLGGLVLMVYPYFVASVLWTLVIGALLLGVVWLAARAAG
jgi:hypothetical protein